MKVIIRYTRLSVTPSAPAEVIRYLQTAKRKEENLYHEQRRHWDEREFDEQVIARESHYQCYETPEQWYLRKAAMAAIQTALASCTKTQRERFLLSAIEGLSYAEIAERQNCSKYAVRDSVEAARKKIQTFLKNRPHESHF